jgi:hypothetical protein
MLWNLHNNVVGLGLGTAKRGSDLHLLSPSTQLYAFSDASVKRICEQECGAYAWMMGSFDADQKYGQMLLYAQTNANLLGRRFTEHASGGGFVQEVERGVSSTRAEAFGMKAVLVAVQSLWKGNVELWMDSQSCLA